MGDGLLIRETGSNGAPGNLQHAAVRDGESKTTKCLKKGGSGGRMNVDAAVLNGATKLLKQPERDRWLQIGHARRRDRIKSICMPEDT
jgi:hypothetical protein